MTQNTRNPASIITRFFVLKYSKDIDKWYSRGMKSIGFT